MLLFSLFFFCFRLKLNYRLNSFASTIDDAEIKTSLKSCGFKFCLYKTFSNGLVYRCFFHSPDSILNRIIESKSYQITGIDESIRVKRSNDDSSTIGDKQWVIEVENEIELGCRLSQACAMWNGTTTYVHPRCNEHPSKLE